MQGFIARHRTVLLCCAAVIFVSSGALAEEEGPETPDLAETERRETYAGTLLDRITITSRTGETPVETMASVSHVGEERLAARMATTPADMMFGVPGIRIYSDSQASMTNINIRGLQDAGRVAVIVDGARQNFHKSGHEVGRMFWIDPELISQVDVVRGPSANTFGSGAIGGVVHFQTRTAEEFLRDDENYALSTSARYQSNGPGWTTSATGAYRFTDRFSVLGNITWRDIGDYADGAGDRVAHTGFDVLSGQAKATVKPSEGSELTLGWRGSRDDWTSQVSAGLRESEVRDNAFTGAFKVSDDEEKWLNLNIKGAYDAIRLTDVDPAETTVYDLGTTSLDIWNSSYFDLGAIHHELTVGLDWVHDDFSSVENGVGADLFNPDGRRTVWGAYVQDKLRYEWLEVVAGLRYDAYQLSASGESSGDRLSPRISVGVSPFGDGPLSGLQFYGSYSEGYRAPNTSEAFIAGMHPNPRFPFLPNPDLTPETGKTWEAGINYGAHDLFLADDRLTLKAAYFHNDIADYIDAVGVTDPALGCFDPMQGIFWCSQYQNVKAARIHGFELEGYYDAGRYFGGVSLSLIDGYSVDEDGVRSALRNSPFRFTVDAGMRFLQSRLTAGAELEFNKAPGSVAWAKDYTLVNLYANYAVNDDLKLNFRVDNLFDTRYQIPLVDVSNNPGNYQPGLTVRLGATMRFGGK